MQPNRLPDGLCQRLRRCIQPAHEAIESTDIARSMLDGSITRGWYAALLRRLIPIHARLERRHRLLQGTPFPAILVARAEKAASDVAALVAASGASSPSETDLGDRRLCGWLEDAPSAGIVGACYIVVGAALGSLVLRRPLATALAIDVDAPGMTYHAGADQVRQAWPSICSAIDRFDGDAEALLDGAETMMRGFGSLYATTSRPD